MDRILAGMQWETCLVYLDYIIVLGRDAPEMLKRLGLVFDRLHQANLKLKPVKCCLFHRQVACLGHIISEDDVADTHISSGGPLLHWPVTAAEVLASQWVWGTTVAAQEIKDGTLSPKCS